MRNLSYLARVASLALPSISPNDVRSRLEAARLAKRSNLPDAEFWTRHHVKLARILHRALRLSLSSSC